MSMNQPNKDLHRNDLGRNLFKDTSQHYFYVKYMVTQRKTFRLRSQKFMAAFENLV